MPENNFKTEPGLIITDLELIQRSSKLKVFEPVESRFAENLNQKNPQSSEEFEIKLRVISNGDTSTLTDKEIIKLLLNKLSL